MWKTPLRIVFLKIALLVAIAVLAVFTLEKVELTPQIDSSLFFGDDDPQLKEDRAIYKIFAQQEQIIINVAGDIHSASYLDKINQLTQRLLEIPQVVSAKSLTQGPKNVEDALKSDFWRRLLIPENGKSSNIFIVLDKTPPQKVIPKIESRLWKATEKNFRPIIAGIPYMIEQIRRRLIHDLKVFSFSSVIVFGLMILIIFRSFSIFAGFLGASAFAAALTLLVSHFTKIGIGLLTANLITIVFVLTIPHLIYLTYNWKRPESGENENLKRALKETFPGSFWSMGTTLLGFLSLLLVEAKPLRQLGASGSIGTVCALIAAYGLYPVFLLGIQPRRSVAETMKETNNKPTEVFKKFSPWIAGGFVVLCLLLGAGIFRLNTDPNLLSYFSQNLRQGLEHVDRNGGSGLMEIVLRDSRGGKLDNDEAYEALWRLQTALEKNPQVGTVISLPLLMAEAEDAPFSFLFSRKTILEKMAKPKYERIAQSFISYDHTYGHFVLRMKESGRKIPRQDVIASVKQTVRENGFKPVLVGGMYPLQAQLSHLVESSLIKGLAEIVLLLGLIGMIVSRSIWVGLIMAVGMALIPVGLLGTIGFLHAPLDIISAPAANLALGMGIDDTMIHMAKRWRELVGKGHKRHEAWQIARKQLFKPIIISMLVVCVGFAIFILSQFPPTRRFGLWVVLGTLLVPPSALFFLPQVASAPVWEFLRKRLHLKSE